MEYLWLDKTDETFDALAFLPWINQEDQFMFYMTSRILMKNSRIAIKHITDNVNVDNVPNRVTGFRILISEGQTQLAMHALLLVEPI